MLIDRSMRQGKVLAGMKENDLEGFEFATVFDMMRLTASLFVRKRRRELVEGGEERLVWCRQGLWVQTRLRNGE